MDDSGAVDASGTAPTISIAAYITFLGPQLAMIVTQAVFTAMLIPLFAILLLMAEPEQRRKPLYYMNVVAI